MTRTIEIVYTWPDGREEVRYRRQEGSADAILLMAEVERQQAKYRDECPYSWRLTPPRAGGVYQ